MFHACTALTLNTHCSTLQPVETSGDRLLVDVVELAASGFTSTSTALASMQACGTDPGTARFKTLRVNGDGVLSVSHASSKTTTNRFHGT